MLTNVESQTKLQMIALFEVHTAVSPVIMAANAEIAKASPFGRYKPISDWFAIHGV